MLLSTTTDNMTALYGDEESVRRIAAAGFDALDYTMYVYPTDRGLLQAPEAEFCRHMEKVKKAADHAGISFGQLHTPMVNYPDTPEKVEEYFRLSRLGLIAAGILDCPYCVIHPIIWPEYRYDKGRAENKAMNFAFYPRLIEDARKNRTVICIENMFNWDPAAEKICPTVVSTAEEMCEYIDELNVLAGDERFAACLDIGHATLTNDTPEHMIRVLGHRLRTLHVQDTDGVHDLHTLPYYGGAVNWDKVCEALREVRYPGTFSYEADNFLTRLPVSVRADALPLMHSVGRALIAKITG